jgi:DNA-binding transcriptional LysR family regulator
MNLRSLDLNLLVVFDAIYHEGNVTRAAAKVGLSQPATSGALSRLRGHLGDELFLRSAEGLRPTPRAIELADRLPGILVELENALEPPTFDPATSEHVLRIASLDYFTVVVIPALLRLFETEAPKVRVHLVPTVGQPFPMLDKGEIDFAFATLFDVDDRFGQERLITDTYSCLVRRGHPLTHRMFDIHRFAAAQHVLVSPAGDPHGFVDDELEKAGLSRQVSLMLNHFSAAPAVVAQSNLILTAPTLVLNKLKTPEHELLDCPVNVPDIYRNLDLIWHQRLSGHPAKIWFRKAIIRAAELASHST